MRKLLLIIAVFSSIILANINAYSEAPQTKTAVIPMTLHALGDFNLIIDPSSLDLPDVGSGDWSSGSVAIRVANNVSGYSWKLTLDTTDMVAGINSIPAENVRGYFENDEDCIGTNYFEKVAGSEEDQNALPRDNPSDLFVPSTAAGEQNYMGCTDHKLGVHVKPMASGFYQGTLTIVLVPVQVS